MNKIIKICKKCFKEFTVLPYREKSASYCSIECKKAMCRKIDVTVEVIKKRFWENVTKLSKNECWFWKGPIGSQGYGILRIGRNFFKTTHRISYELHNGEIPDLSG